MLGGENLAGGLVHPHSSGLGASIGPVERQGGRTWDS